MNKLTAKPPAGNRRARNLPTGTPLAALVVVAMLALSACTPVIHAVKEPVPDHAHDEVTVAQEIEMRAIVAEALTKYFAEPDRRHFDHLRHAPPPAIPIVYLDERATFPAAERIPRGLEFAPIADLNDAALTVAPVQVAYNTAPEWAK